ncbi:MAG: recombinase family protein [Kordiimonadaceae bacterium]|nr:recombinase family protein [Kordiimonadaceae bacterium]
MVSKKIGYARVSTKKQTLTMQRQALKAAGCNRVYSDNGVSGKVFPRKGLTQALDALEAGDTLVVYKQDRLGRLVLELARLLHYFLSRKIVFLSLTQSMDITTPSGRLMYYFCAVLAEHESDQTGERTRDGMEVKKTKGSRFGRKPLLSAANAMAAREMLAAGGVTVADTARLFDVSPRTLKRAIKALESEAA